MSEEGYRNLKAHDPQVTTTLEVYDYQRDTYEGKQGTVGFDIRGFQLDKSGVRYELSFVKHFENGKMVSRAGKLKMTYSTFNELKHVLDVV